VKRRPPRTGAEVETLQQNQLGCIVLGTCDIQMLALGSEKLGHLAHAAWLIERRRAEKRIARLADVVWGPALGAYRKHHQPPPYPPDAPPLPRRLVHSSTGSREP
jgi:hypothetical protein